MLSGPVVETKVAVWQLGTKQSSCHRQIGVFCTWARALNEVMRACLHTSRVLSSYDMHIDVRHQRNLGYSQTCFLSPPAPPPLTLGLLLPTSVYFYTVQLRPLFMPRERLFSQFLPKFLPVLLERLACPYVMRAFSRALWLLEREVRVNEI
jgi:hypothetical protein